MADSLGCKYGFDAIAIAIWTKPILDQILRFYTGILFQFLLYLGFAFGLKIVPFLTVTMVTVSG